MRFAILDTSSILFGFSNMKDTFEIVKERFPGRGILVSKGVLRELAGISLNRGRRGTSARAALEAIRYKKIEVDNDNKDVDPWVVAAARRYPHSVVITNDTELYKKLKNINIESFKLTKDGHLK